MTPLEFVAFVAGGALAVAIGTSLAPLIAPGVAWCVGATADVYLWLRRRVGR